MSLFRSFLRSLIVGPNQYIFSHKYYKRILLTGQLCLITAIVCFGYLVLDFVNHVPHAWPYQLGCLVLAIASFLFNRNGYFTTAKLMLGFTVNLTVFIFSINEPEEVGVYMYFIACNLGAMIAFGYEERGKAFFFVLFSTSLFVLSLFIHADFIERPVYSEEYVRINMIINFFGASLSSFVLAYFLINVNYRAEAQMMRREKELAETNSMLTKVNSELDRFVYSSSHDLRAPLHSIQGLIQLTDFTKDPEELRKYIDMMRGRVTSLEKFILDIANYARNSRQALVPETISIKRLLINSLEGLLFFPGAEKIKIHRQVPDDLMITTDVTRLKIVLDNIISNALKYHDKKKENNFIKVSAEQLDDKIAIAIEDNGIGIPEDSLDKIFKMYSRAHTQSFGSGLGLYIVKETLEKLQGEVQVKSVVGVGSTFTIVVPNLSSIGNSPEPVTISQEQ